VLATWHASVLESGSPLSRVHALGAWWLLPTQDALPARTHYPAETGPLLYSSWLRVMDCWSLCNKWYNWICVHYLFRTWKCDDHQLERGFLLGFCTHAAWICIAVQCDLIDLSLSWLVGYLENNKYNESVNGKDLAALKILNFQFSASGNKFYAGIIKQKKLFLDGSNKEFKGRLCVQKFKEHCKPSSWS